ncbi:MAG: hypothetical protein DCF25_20715 [Leptolyngbya foveolarum]|uniref:Uncharacterized protein n=1 Tax=Leptolyngbya foveolarum TaxID=47253 RepID=A0A2W4TZA0_9CYAN|nr:MAG: hypothetical protein DCF25_20715 [Leptolyngbya foveolarum]
MDEWLKQLQRELNEAAQVSSQLLTKVARQSEQIIEQWADSSLEAIEAAERSIEENVAPAFLEVNDQLDAALDASVDFLSEQVTPWLEKVTAPIVNTVNPLIQDHPICVGCRNYHGADYGNEMLVCGMHPYGPEDEICADWESVWPGMSNED